MLDPIQMPNIVPEIRGIRVVLRAAKDGDVDDRLAFPIDPKEEDQYGASWRREWDGRTHHTREYLLAQRASRPADALLWAVEYDKRCVGSAGLIRVNVGDHNAAYTIGIFDPGLRGIGLGREVTALVLDWGFQQLGLHRIELNVVASNERAIRCYQAVGFRSEGIRREIDLHPAGFRDWLHMAVLANDDRPQRPATGNYASLPMQATGDGLASE